MKTAIIYRRVSTDHQVTNGYSLQNQQQLLTAYCHNNNYNIIELSDNGLSGTSNKRPGFNKLLELVKSKKVDAVVVYSLSRFARSLKDTLQAVELFKKHSITFISLTENFDTSTPHGSFTLNILASLAELESKITSNRIKDVLQYKKTNGYCVGTVPFGFDKTNDKLLIENHDEQATLKLIKRLIKKGTSYQGICDYLIKKKRLNKKGICSWNKGNLFRLIKNL